MTEQQTNQVDVVDEFPQIAAHLRSFTIPQLVEQIATTDDEESRRIYARELHRRGVSIVGLIPRNHASEQTSGKFVSRRASVVDPRPEF